jgi:zinc protease
MEAQKVNFPEVILAAAPEFKSLFYDVPGAKQSVLRIYPALAATDANFYPVEIMNYRLVVVVLHRN